MHALFVSYDGVSGTAETPSLKSLYTTASFNASKEATTIFGFTPMVRQLSPLSSTLSMVTRVTASVPVFKIRTLKSTSFMVSIAVA